MQIMTYSWHHLLSTLELMCSFNLYFFNQNVEIKKPHVVKKVDLNAFATTHYHMSEGTVERERESTEVSLS